jgi:hypothetical protein
MSLEDALQFVRDTDDSTWSRLVQEMNATRKRRDLEAAKRLTVGNLAFFDAPDPTHSCKGRIINIARGRVTLAVASQESGFLERIGVPASMVRQDTING